MPTATRRSCGSSPSTRRAVPGEPFSPYRRRRRARATTEVALRGPWQGSNLVDGRHRPHPTSRRACPNTTSTSPEMRSRRAAPTSSGHNGSPRGSTPTTYARVVTEPQHPGRLALQYWFFYVFNDFNDKHEGDWEMIQLDFDAPDATAGARGVRRPTWATASTTAPSAADWDDVKAREGRRHAPGRVSGRGVACQLLRPGALPGEQPDRGRGLRQHPRTVSRAAACSEARAGRSGRHGGGVPLAGVRGQLGREACRLL